jgi:hypothetical protein
MMNRFE